MTRVKIINKNPGGAIHTFVDGEELNGIRAINFDVEAKDRNPKFEIEIQGIPDIDLDGRIDFPFSPRTVEEAAKVLRHTLITNNDLYNGLVASIESAIRESTVVWEEWEYTETARRIADRIVGKGGIKYVCK